MRAQYRILLLSLIVLLVFSACGGGGEKKEEESGPSQDQPTATSGPAPTQQPQETAPTSPPPTEVVQPTATTGGGESGSGTVADLLNLSALETDIKELSSETLQSYRLRAEWKTEPKTGSTVTASSYGIEVAHTNNPLAEEITMRGDATGLDSQMVRIEDRMWINAGDQWIEMSSDDTSTYDNMLFSLSSATSGLTGDAKLVGEETLNGVATKHYTFDESILGAALGVYEKIKGEVWVAVDGDYAVKYVFTAEDKDATYDWNWEVYDINAPFTIEPPTDAQGAREDIPLLSDATDRVTFGAMVSYSSATALQAAIDFYKEQMPTFDWTYDEAGSMLTEGFAMLNFGKEGETVSIMLSASDSGGTDVVIQGGE